MEKIIYRSLEKKDYREVENLINDSFGLYNYVENVKMLEKVKRMYLCSCLAEQKDSIVAVKDNKIVGIIMGASKNEKFKVSNILNTMKLMYYTAALFIMNINKKRGCNEVHKAYNELIKGENENFNGVLTLFIVKEGLRGFGIGKELLFKLKEYYVEHKSNRIYLYTDDTCNYGFYEHMGFDRIREKQVTIVSKNKEKKLNVYLYNLEIQ